MKKLLRRTGQGVAVVLLALGLAELFLRSAALFVGERNEAGWRPGAEIRVLALGDSHTYGGGIPPSEAYPAHLQHFLDERAPGVYSVVNRGIPGMNTSQVRKRLAVSLAHWNPSVVVIWCGVNNGWNSADRDAGSLMDRIDARLLGLRLYRFARVWLHQRAMQREIKPKLDGGRHVFKLQGKSERRVPFYGVVRHSRHTGKGEQDLGFEDWAAEDYAAMVRIARAAGVEILFIAYPLNIVSFRVANKAIRRTARALDAPVVEGVDGMKRVPEEEGRFEWALHPSPKVYREIARDVADAILSLPISQETLAGRRIASGEEAVAPKEAGARATVTPPRATR